MRSSWFSKESTNLQNLYQNLDEFSIGRNIIQLKDIDSLKKNDVVLLSSKPQLLEAFYTTFLPLSYNLNSIRLINAGSLEEMQSEPLEELLQQLLSSPARIIILHLDFQIQKLLYKVMDQFENPYEALYMSSNNRHESFGELEKCKRFIEFGIQGHLSSLKSRNNDHLRIRLGDLKSNLLESEPYLRNQNIVSLNIDVLKHSIMPGQKNCGPAGLNAEEITQLFRYLGYNSRLKVININHFEESDDFNNQGSKLLSQIIWYYLDALNMCIREDLHRHESLIEFVVDIHDIKEPLTFIKGEKTGRWWLKDYRTDQLIPCSLSDYELACQNEIPNKLFE